MEDDQESLMDRLLEQHRKEELAQAFDQAITKWLDKKFAEVGKWTIRGIGALVLAGLVWAYIHTGGFK